jgi:hypothetical protein
MFLAILYIANNLYKILAIPTFTTAQLLQQSPCQDS